MMKDDEWKAMADAIVNYSGPVTHCPPGMRPKRRKWKVWSKAVKERPSDPRANAGWRHDDEPKPKQQRRQRRIARARRQRIEERNALVRKRLN
jgi:hypothetical protein